MTADWKLEMELPVAANLPTRVTKSMFSSMAGGGHSRSASAFCSWSFPVGPFQLWKTPALPVACDDAVAVAVKASGQPCSGERGSWGSCLVVLGQQKTFHSRGTQCCL